MGSWKIFLIFSYPRLRCSTSNIPLFIDFEMPWLLVTICYCWPTIGVSQLHLIGSAICQLVTCWCRPFVFKYFALCSQRLPRFVTAALAGIGFKFGLDNFDSRLQRLILSAICTSLNLQSVANGYIHIMIASKLMHYVFRSDLLCCLLCCFWPWTTASVLPLTSVTWLPFW